MTVIRRQPVFMKTPAKPLDSRREQGEKLQPVAILPEDVFPFIAPDVPEGTFELQLS
jgi:hypothetical protein